MYLCKYQPYLSRIKESLKLREWLKRREFTRTFDRDMKSVRPFYVSNGVRKSIEKTVLFASFLPLPYVIKIEGLFSKALQERGWKSLCLYTRFSDIAGTYHKSLYGSQTLRLDRFISWTKYRTISEEIEGTANEDFTSIKDFEYKGCPVGIHALATLSSSEPSGQIRLSSSQRKALKGLLIRSCLNVEACEAICRKYKPDLIVAVEKGFVGCCEIYYQALAHGIDYVQWCGCHEPESIMMKRYHMGNRRAHPFSVSPRTWKMMQEKPWDEACRKTVMQEFEDGYRENKWFKYKKLADHTNFYGRSEIVAKYSLDPAKKIAVIFSPILNDANLFYGTDLFQGGFQEWLVETVRSAMTNEFVNWILKLHPANNYRRSSSGYKGEYGEILAIREAFGSIPDRLKIMYPDDDVNPLSLFQCIDYGLTVRGTVGAEIPCFGNPALTAGTGRYSGLSFTEDSSSAEEYLAKVQNIHTIGPLSEERVRLAIKHAHLFFKVRPAKYQTGAHDVYEFPQGHAFYRDIRFKAQHYSELLDNPQLRSIVNWISQSKDEDFLNDNS